MKPLIVANWKCNPPTKKEAEELFSSVSEGVKDIQKVYPVGSRRRRDSFGAEVVICPPFVYFPVLTGLSFGSQDCFWEEKGAFTGEISPLMLKDLGCKYAIVGHSERRKYFGETDEIVNKKLKAVLEAGLNPILCIGETQEQRDRGETETILKKQLELGLTNLPTYQLKNLVIAYEPIWAIGTGNACDSQEAERVSLFILETVSKILGKEIRILYGGSVNAENAASYMKEKSINGLLVGGASLKAEEFVKIVKGAGFEP